MAARTPRGVRRRQRTIYLPESMDRRVRVRAAQQDTTVSVVILQALRAYLAGERGEQKKPGKAT